MSATLELLETQVLHCTKIRNSWRSGVGSRSFPHPPPGGVAWAPGPSCIHHPGEWRGLWVLPAFTSGCKQLFIFVRCGECPVRQSTQKPLYLCLLSHAGELQPRLQYLSQRLFIACTDDERRRRMTRMTESRGEVRVRRLRGTGALTVFVCSRGCSRHLSIEDQVPQIAS